MFLLPSAAAAATGLLEFGEAAFSLLTSVLGRSTSAGFASAAFKVGEAIFSLCTSFALGRRISAALCSCAVLFEELEREVMLEAIFVLLLTLMLRPGLSSIAVALLGLICVEKFRAFDIFDMLDTGIAGLEFLMILRDCAGIIAWVGLATSTAFLTGMLLAGDILLMLLLVLLLTDALATELLGDTRLTLLLDRPALGNTLVTVLLERPGLVLAVAAGALLTERGALTLGVLFILAGLLTLADFEGAAALLLLVAGVEGRCPSEEDLVLSFADDLA